MTFWYLNCRQNKTHGAHSSSEWEFRAATAAAASVAHEQYLAFEKIHNCRLLRLCVAYTLGCSSIQK